LVRHFLALFHETNVSIYSMSALCIAASRHANGTEHLTADYFDVTATLGNRQRLRLDVMALVERCYLYIESVIAFVRAFFDSDS
jgi:hypothetical protein